MAKAFWATSRFNGLRVRRELLKRFCHSSSAITGLKPGVNEIVKQDMKATVHKLSSDHGHEMAHGLDDHAHHDPGFWRTYVFSPDHKVIGIQYGLTSLCFMLFGFFLMLLMRWQISKPGVPIPVFGPLLEKVLGSAAPPRRAVAGPLQLFRGDARDDHGVSGGRAAGLRGVFGNFVIPLQIGAPDMAFPRLNMASYQAFVIGGVIMLTSFFIPGGAAQAGWTSYSPLATIDPHRRADFLAGRHGFHHHVVDC